MHSLTESIDARVSFSAHEEYRILLADGTELIAAPSGGLRCNGELPAVGDWVRVKLAPGLAIVHEVMPRKTAFVRKAAGKTNTRQCVAANIDVCFAVCGLDGDFNLRRIERYLVLARESGAAAVAVLNKADRCDDLDAAIATVRGIAGDIEVVTLTATHSAEALMEWLTPGVTTVLLGSSGVGKSTIASALTGRGLAAREVREWDSRGRHTTSASMLLPIAGGAWLIDTPGMRELGLLASDAAIEASFGDIAELANDCRFGDCTHGQEPGCAVRAAREQGMVSDERWESYRKLQREARYHAVSADANAQREQKRKWKVIHQAAKIRRRFN